MTTKKTKIELVREELTLMRSYAQTKMGRWFQEVDDLDLAISDIEINLNTEWDRDLESEVDDLRDLRHDYDEFADYCMGVMCLLDDILDRLKDVD